MKKPLPSPAVTAPPKGEPQEAAAARRSLSAKHTTLWLTTTAMFMAATVALCSFSIPVPGGHLYLCDVAICMAAILLDPLGAFLVGGVGSFLGDLLFYPLPMFVSLASHGVQAFPKYRDFLRIIHPRGTHSLPFREELRKKCLYLSN